MAKILVVDDERLICWSLKKIFEKLEGYSVHPVHTGSDALQQITENRYDMVITDLKLPDITGLEIVKKIRELGIDIPVIVISAYFSEHIRDAVMKHGAFKCINKPFEMVDILNNVKEAIGT